MSRQPQPIDWSKIMQFAQPAPRKHDPRWAGVMVVLLLLLRVGLLLQSPAGLSGDAFGYMADARWILSTGTLPPLRVQPHGFAVLSIPLALFTDDTVGPWILRQQVLLDTAVVVVLVWLSVRILPPETGLTPRLLCQALVLIQPFTCTMVTALYTETWAMFLMFFGGLSLAWGTHAGDKLGLRIVGGLLWGIAGTMRTDLLLLNGGLLAIHGLVAWSRHRRDYRVACQWAAVCLAFSLPAGGMIAAQVASTGEYAVVSPKFYHPGYMAWLRTWFAFAGKDYERVAFIREGADWAGLDQTQYPRRSFDDPHERAQVFDLLERWRLAGYDEHLDREFQELTRRKVERHPIRQYVLLPCLRMAHLWINWDGAQSILAVIPIRRPVSTLIVGLTFLLRGVLVGLALLGLREVLSRVVRGRDAEDVAGIGLMALLMAGLRTLELGALSPFVWAGLMEVRYVLPVFPQLLLLSIFGVASLAKRHHMAGATDGHQAGDQGSAKRGVYSTRRTATMHMSSR